MFIKWFKNLEDFSKKTSFEKYVALSTSIIAVCLSLSTIFANQVGDDLLIYRAKANNEWSRFQSKSIKENLFEVELEGLNLEKEKEDNSAKYQQKIEEKISFFSKEIKRYKTEKEEIKRDAMKHEKICEVSDAKGNVLDLAEGFYQISLILAAISLVSRTAVLWALSMIMGSIGIITTINALLFY